MTGCGYMLSEISDTTNSDSCSLEQSKQQLYPQIFTVYINVYICLQHKLYTEN